MNECEARKTPSGNRLVANHNLEAAPRERQEAAGRHFLLVRDAYENRTGNAWKIPAGYGQAARDQLGTGCHLSTTRHHGI